MAEAITLHCFHYTLMRNKSYRKNNSNLTLPARTDNTHFSL